MMDTAKKMSLNNEEHQRRMEPTPVTGEFDTEEAKAFSDWMDNKETRNHPRIREIRKNLKNRRQAREERETGEYGVTIKINNKA